MHVCLGAWVPGCADVIDAEAKQEGEAAVDLWCWEEVKRQVLSTRFNHTEQLG